MYIEQVRLALGKHVPSKGANMGIQSSTQRSAELISGFLQHSNRRRVASRSTIIRQDESSQDLFYIVSGTVTVRIEGDDGDEMVVAHLDAGEFFGELGLFGEDLPRSATVRAKTACDIAQVAYEQLRAMQYFPLDLLFLLTSQMATRLRKIDQKYNDLAHINVAGRVAKELLELCDSPSAITHPKGMLVRVSRVELGKIVAASREMIARVLARLEKQGLICFDGKSVVVLRQETGAASRPQRPEGPATEHSRSAR